MVDTKLDAQTFINTCHQQDDLAKYFFKFKYIDLYQNEANTPWEIVANALTTSDINTIDAKKLAIAVEELKTKLPTKIYKGLNHQLKILVLLKQMHFGNIANISKLAMIKLSCLQHYCKNRLMGYININGYEAFIKEHSAANYPQVNLANANLNHFNFKNSSLVGSNFQDSMLDFTDFTGANLANATFTHSKLQNTNFNTANLTKANFRGAHMHGADLSRANLTAADLTHADLSGANLSGANLKDVKLDRANLKQAIFLNEKAFHQSEKKFANEIRNVLMPFIGSKYYHMIQEALAQNIKMQLVNLASNKPEENWEKASRLLHVSCTTIRVCAKKSIGSTHHNRSFLFHSNHTLEQCRQELEAVKPSPSNASDHKLT